jgi:hypothetical protein
VFTGEKEFNEVLSNENQECIARHCVAQEEKCYEADALNGFLCSRALDCIYNCDNTRPECMAGCLEAHFGPLSPANPAGDNAEMAAANPAGKPAAAALKLRRQARRLTKHDPDNWGLGAECGPVPANFAADLVSALPFLAAVAATGGEDGSGSGGEGSGASSTSMPYYQCPAEWADYFSCVTDESCLSRAHFQRRGRFTAFFRWLRAVLYEGHFSLFPFISFPFLGFGLGGILFRDYSLAGSRRRSRVFGICFASLASIATGLLVFEKSRSDARGEGLNYVQIFDEKFAQYPFGTGPYLVFSTAAIFGLLWAFEPLNRQDGDATEAAPGDGDVPAGSALQRLARAAAGYLLRTYQFLNRYLLSFFFYQGIVILWPLRALSIYQGHRDQWELYEKKPVEPWVAVVLSYLYIAAMGQIMAVWERRWGSVGTLEWIVRAGAG